MVDSGQASRNFLHDSLVCEALKREERLSLWVIHFYFFLLVYFHSEDAQRGAAWQPRPRCACAVLLALQCGAALGARPGPGTLVPLRDSPRQSPSLHHRHRAARWSKSKEKVGRHVEKDDVLEGGRLVLKKELFLLSLLPPHLLTSPLPRFPFSSGCPLFP